MKKTLLFIFVLITSSKLLGQDFEWTRSLGNELEANSITAVATDSDGNIYNCGYFEGTIDFDPGPNQLNLSSTYKNIFLQKLDPNGNLIWAIAFDEGERGSEAYHMSLDNEGNILIAGSAINLGSSGGISYAILIYKLDASGNVIFRIESSGDNGSTNRARQIEADNENSIIVSGSFSGPTEFGTAPNNFALNSVSGFDLFFLKLNPNGEIFWAKQIGGQGNTSLQDFSIDPIGNFYLGGTFGGSMDFDPSSNSFEIDSGPQGAAYLCKMDNDGDLIWAYKYEGSGFTTLNGVDTSSNQDVFISGYYNSDIILESSSGSINLNFTGNESNLYLAKIDSEGALVWIKSMSGDSGVYPEGIKVDSSDNIFLFGYFFGTADLDPESTTNNFTENGQGDIFLQKYCDDTLLWTEAYGGSGIDFCKSIDVDSNANIILGGDYYYANLDFDPGNNMTESLLINAGQRDAFTLKLSQSNFITPMAFAPDDLVGCDDNNDGISENFDTSLIESQVIGNQNLDCFDVVVRYFDELGNELPSPLPNPFTNSTPNSQTITIQVANALNLNFYSETTITLETSDGPNINTPTDRFACDEGNGFGSFDMSLIENEILGIQSGLQVLYFDGNNNALPSPLPNLLENNIPFMETISVKVIDLANPSCVSETSFNLIITESPAIELQPQYFICESDISILLEIESDYTSYEWLDESNELISSTYFAEIFDEGLYTLNANITQNGNSCSNSFTFELIRTSPPQIQTVNTGFTLNNFIEIITFENGDYEYSIDGINYQDSNIFQNISGGSYTATVRDRGGCGDDSRDVIVIDFPSHFSPNDDGFNDYWQVRGISNFPNAKIYIFDRYGKLLKQLSPMSRGWNGRYLGKVLPTNDYWFIVEFEQQRLGGHFTLKR